MACFFYPCLNIRSPLAVLYFFGISPVFKCLFKKLILAIQGSSSACPFNTQGDVLFRLLIWTLFIFSRCCLTSSFIAYGKLSIPSTTLHEVKASFCFILNTEEKNLSISMYFASSFKVLLCTSCRSPIFLLLYCLLCTFIHLPFFSLMNPHALFFFLCVSCMF